MVFGGGSLTLELEISVDHVVGMQVVHGWKK